MHIYTRQNPRFELLERTLEAPTARAALNRAVRRVRKPGCRTVNPRTENRISEDLTQADS